MARSINLAIFAFVFIVSLRPPVDLDLGWHLRYGEYFFKTGHVLTDNPLSVVWPQYQWVQASWGFDLIVYQLFTRFSFLGLSLTASLFTLLIFYLLTKPLTAHSPAKLLFLAFIFLTQTAPLYGTGLRAQTLSALMFTLVLLLTIRLLSSTKLPNYLYILLPVIFLIWANLHGGFALGLILITLLLIPKITQLKIFLTLALSWLAPLINPWGPRLYQEAFTHSRNLNLTVISEWMPLNLTSLEGIISLGVLLLALLTFFKLRRRLPELPSLLSLLLLAYLGFSALRFMMLFGVMVTYFLALNLPKTLPAKLSLLVWLVLPLLVILDALGPRHYFIFPPPRLLTFSWGDYCQVLPFSDDFQAKDCSEEITELMLTDPPAAAGFHPYNYGGYLSWRVPQVKTFVDGRMAAWEENGLTPPVVEGDEVFLDPTPLTWHKFDALYHFRWAIVPTQTPIVAYLDNLVTINLWQRRYQDQFYSYYVKQ
ncbi:MAG: hypothetical protein HYS86_00030 [Candidatus Chisholmbacteria bacterium]|nr:hypothetical protein [Candidatus Chisholmbacteria bacterium]